MNNSTNPFRCEFCGHFLKLSNMVQITITRNPLEDSNVISKSHVFCQECWNTSQLFIRGKEIV